MSRFLVDTDELEWHPRKAVARVGKWDPDQPRDEGGRWSGAGGGGESSSGAMSNEIPDERGPAGGGGASPQHEIAREALSNLEQRSTWAHVTGRSAEQTAEDFVRGTPLVAYAVDTSARLGVVRFGAELAVDGVPVGRVERSVHMDPEGSVVVHNDKLVLTGSGRGYGKEISRQTMEVAERVGAHRIELLASAEVGGYAWARYGFLPQNPPALARDIGERWAQLRDTVGPAMQAQIDDALGRLGRGEARALWEISDANAVPVLGGRRPGSPDARPTDSIGAHLLLGQAWRGEMVLADGAARARFEQYTRPGR